MQSDARYLSVVMPAYNEETALRDSVTRLLEELDKFTSDYEVIIVNDGSLDSTLDKIKELVKENNHVRAVSYRTNKGKGHAIKRGFQKAEGHFIAIMDADMDIHPKQIRGYLERLESEHQKNNLIAGVIGSKFEKDSKVDFPIQRRIMSMVYYQLLHQLFRLDLKDTQTGLKVFEGSKIKEVLPRLTIRGFAYDIELLTAIYRTGSRVIPAPIECEYTRTARRINVKHIAKTFSDTMNIFVADRRGRYSPK